MYDMQRHVSIIFSAAAMLAGALTAAAQTESAWTLRRCIDYARENNIQVQQTVLQKQNADEDLLQARASAAPSLSAFTNQNFSFSRDATDDYSLKGLYAGDYGLSASMTIWAGGRIKNNRYLQEINSKAAGLDVLAVQNSIETSVTLAYLNVLYARESVITAENTLQASRAQAQRAEQMLLEGAISRSDCAQFTSQYASDNYNLVSAQNNLSESILSLKQLLELGLGEDFPVEFPLLGDENVLKPIPEIAEVYSTACEIMPDMQAAELDIQSAQLSEKIAQASMMPSVSASASLGTSNVSGIDTEFFTQLGHQVNGAVGLTLTIPILDGHSARTSYNKAKNATLSARLSQQNARKEMLSTVESLHQDAVSAQSRYIAARQKLSSAEVSYNLQCEKFEEGMINAVDLLSEKNTYTAAQQELNQSKYQAILSVALLNFYLGLPINL